MGSTRIPSACVYILLLLSLHHTDAMRKIVGNRAAAKAARAQPVLREMQEALQEDELQAAQGGEYIFEEFATCEERQEDFVRRSEKVRTSVEAMYKDGKVDFVEFANTAMKARTLTSTLSAAAKKKCGWMQEIDDKKNLDARKSLTAVVEVTGAKSGMSACAEKAKKVLESAQHLGAPQQARSFKNAIGMLISKTCEEQKEASFKAGRYRVDKKGGGLWVTQRLAWLGKPEPPVEAKDGTVVEVVEIGHLKDFIRGMLKGGGWISLMDTKTGEAWAQPEVTEDDVEDDMNDEVEQLKRKGVDFASVLQTGLTQSASDRDQTGSFEGLVKFIFIVILTILWAVFCWVVAAIFMAIIGFICCALKAVILSLKTTAHDVDFTGCLGWWMGALGHDQKHQGGEDVAICCAKTLGGPGLWGMK